MNESLLAEWNELQTTNVPWGNTPLLISKTAKEIQILEGLKNEGERTAPNGLPIDSQIESRQDVLRKIWEASRND